MAWKVDTPKHTRTLAGVRARERENRWNAPGRARVIHPVWGTLVVPHHSNLAAILNAAEVWGCDWVELTDAKVWAAEPEDVAVKRPYDIQEGDV